MHSLKCVLVLADINTREGFQGYSISYYSMNEVSILSQRVLHVNKISGKWRLLCIVICPSIKIILHSKLV